MLGCEADGQRMVDTTDRKASRLRFKRTECEEAANHVRVHDRREDVEELVIRTGSIGLEKRDRVGNGRRKGKVHVTPSR